MSKLRSRSKVEREMVAELADRGWQHQGRNGQNHERMMWPASGESLIIPGKGRPEFPPVDRPEKSFPRGFQFQQMTPLVFWALDIPEPARASLRARVGMPPPPFGRFTRTWYAAVSDGMRYQYGASRDSWRDAANDAIVLLSRIGIIYPGDEVIPLPGSNGLIDKLRHALGLTRPFWMRCGSMKWR